MGSLLRAAPLILTSELTLVECERALHRLVHGGSITLGQSQERRNNLALAASHWNILAIDRTVVDIAKGRFPVEPVRALDALHLSTALAARAMVPTLVVLSLDRRIRENAPALGFTVFPP